MPSLTTTTPLTERYAAAFPESARRYQQAQNVFPDGVTHDIRYLTPFPVYVERAVGSRKWTVEGRELIDYFCGHGSLILGHSHPAMVEAVQRQAALGTHLGACHDWELQWGQWVQKLVPTAERVRFTASGTEATLLALRLARMYTGRPKFLKFLGHFHGWHDFAVPGAFPPYDDVPPGIASEVTAHTVVIPPNDLKTLERTLASDPAIGAVILEPTGGHWGMVPIRGAFLQGLRDLTAKYDRLLIFDEVITGFRVHPGGAQGHYGIRPDLTTLAKVLAGGLPGGALAGRADILGGIEFRAGKGKLKHPGTFNANPVSAAAGVATLQQIATGVPTQRATELARRLRQRLNTMFAQKGHRWVCYGDFSFWLLLSQYDGPRPDADDFLPYGGAFEKLDGPRHPKLKTAFRQAMLLNGVDVPNLGGFLSAAHTDADIEQTVSAVEHAVECLADEGIA